MEDEQITIWDMALPIFFAFISILALIVVYVAPFATAIIVAYLI